MVFAAFIQHCIQSTVTHLTHVEGVKDAKILLYSVYSGLFAPARREGYFLQYSI